MLLTILLLGLGLGLTDAQHGTEGLEKLDIRLLGTKVDEISARGSLSIKVKRHSAKVFRLRPKLGITGKRYNHFKDEL